MPAHVRTLEPTRDRRPGHCPAVAQILLRYDDERHWLRAAARQVGHLFPRLLRNADTTSG